MWGWGFRRGADPVQYTVYETDPAGHGTVPVRITEDTAREVFARALATPGHVTGSLHWDCARCGAELTADLDRTSFAYGTPGLAFAARLHYCAPVGLWRKLRCLARGYGLAGYVLTPALPPGVRSAPPGDFFERPG